MKKLVIIFLLSTGISYLVWSVSNRGIGVGTPRIDKIQSVSYSPFRRGQSPDTGDFPSTAEMEADLALLSNYVEGIRIYSGVGALGQIPALAKKHGLRVWLGAWLDSNQDTNRTEIDAVIELAGRYPETITRVIVGNENLYRLDITPARLRSYLDEVRRAVDQPVTYADGWVGWFEHPEIASAVDVVTIHILPYWESNPLPVENTIHHVKRILSKMKKAFPDKPVAIGEIGWPSYGRSRREAVPSIVQQAQFIDAIQTVSRERVLDYNIIEAFDQPWKAVTEGTVGSHWGLFTENRTKKFVAGQPIVPYPQWRTWVVLAAVIAGLLSLICVSKYQIGEIGVIIRIVITAQVLANLVVLCTIHLWLRDNYWSPWMLLGMVQLIFAYLLIDTIGRKPSTDHTATHLQDTLFLIRHAMLEAHRSRPDLITVIYHFFSISGIIVAWGMVLQPRFRDFPTLVYLVPSAGISIAGLLHCVAPFKTWRWVVRSLGMKFGDDRWTLKQSLIQLREETLVGFALCSSAILVVIGETPKNLEAMGFSLTLILLSTPYWGTIVLKGAPEQ